MTHSSLINLAFRILHIKNIFSNPYKRRFWQRSSSNNYIESQMSFLTVCRKARAWQQHMKALSSINSLQYDLSLQASAWLQVQRFHGTSTSPLAAAAGAADVQQAGSVSHTPLETRRKYPKRRRLVEADVLDMAKRVFEMPLDKDFLDEATEIPDSSSPSAQPQPQISSELLEEHNDRLAAVDKKREKYPVRPGEVSSYGVLLK